MPEPSATEPSPLIRQRVGAYAVLRRFVDEREQILLTRMSARTPIVGRWTLPGGGIEHGEDPWDAVVREVWEETGLRVRATEVLTVTSRHSIGMGRSGEVEDYHGIHLVFAAVLEPGQDQVQPTVLEQDSSTDISAWVDLEEARRLPLLTAAATVLGVPRP